MVSKSNDNQQATRRAGDCRTEPEGSEWRFAPRSVGFGGNCCRCLIGPTGGELSELTSSAAFRPSAWTAYPRSLRVLNESEKVSIQY